MVVGEGVHKTEEDWSWVTVIGEVALRTCDGRCREKLESSLLIWNSENKAGAVIRIGEGLRGR